MAEVKEKANEKTAKGKTVKIRLPKTKELSDDVFVSVNDRTWLIERGKTVDVPECVAEVLQHQEEMMDICMAFDENHNNG